MKIKQKIREKNSSFLTILFYVIVFIITWAGVFFYYYRYNRTFIWKFDGWDQHVKALTYYSKYIHTFIRTLLTQHRFVLPQWDFSIGEGNDILQTLHYYCIGNPFTFLLCLLPTHKIYIFYDILIVIYLFLAGLSFIILCREINLNDSTALVCGAIAYTFSFYSIYQSARHPFFLCPLFLFPMLITGIERIKHGKSSFLFHLTIFFAALSNIYFFYNMVLLMMIYVVVCMLFHELNIQKVIHIFIPALLGTLSAGIILFPLLYNLLHDPRLVSGNTFHLFYPAAYYIKLCGIILFSLSEYRLFLGVGPVVFAAWIVSTRNFKKKLFLFSVIGSIFIIFPIVGQVFNGFSYSANRWSWAMTLVLSLLLTQTVETGDLLLPSFFDRIAGAVISGVFIFLLLLTDDPAYKHTIIPAISIFLVLSILSIRKLGTHTKKAFLLITVILNAFLMSYWHNSPAGENYAASVKSRENFYYHLFDNETAEIQNHVQLQADGEATRYTGPNLTKNAGMLRNLSSTQYYWSFSNPYAAEFRSEMELPEIVSFIQNGYDNRAALLALSSVNYYTDHYSKITDPPYGFERITDNTYGSEYALPMVYTYSSYILRENFEKMNIAQKQNSMLYAAVLDGSMRNFDEWRNDIPAKELLISQDFCENGIEFTGNSFIVNRPGASCRFNIRSLPDSETYLSFSNLHFSGIPDPNLNIIQKLLWIKPDSTTIQIMTDIGTDQMISYYTEDNPHYSGRHNICKNLGYHEAVINKITMIFSEIGIYTFDNINSYSVPTDFFREIISERQKQDVSGYTTGSDNVSFDISLDEDNIVCVSIPFSDGWNLYVDRQPSELSPLNIKYMGFPLTSGVHHVELRYVRPWSKAGSCISIAAMIMSFIYYGALKKRYIRR